MHPDDTLIGDLLLGAEPIAQYLTQLFHDRQITRKEVYNWCEASVLPHTKHGSRIVASKTRIRQHFQLPPQAAFAKKT